MRASAPGEKGASRFYPSKLCYVTHWLCHTTDWVMELPARLGQCFYP